MSPWLRRAVVAAVLVLVVVAGSALLRFEPEPVAVGLLTLLVLSVGLAVTLPHHPVLWGTPSASERVGRGSDQATLTHLRHLESHLAARHPDAVVRDTLARLADRVLRLRHGVPADSDRGRALLGPALCEVIEGPVVRLGRRRIDTCLRTIEEL